MTGKCDICMDDHEKVDACDLCGQRVCPNCSETNVGGVPGMEPKYGLVCDDCLRKD